MFKKEYYSELSEQKDSVLLHLLLPAIGVMLLQVAMISLVLFSNGTIASLEQNARDSLTRSAENRSLTLENMMVNSWSNLDALEAKLQGIAAGCAAAYGLTAEELLGDSARERAMINEMVEPLLNELLIEQSTGVFVFLTGAEDAAKASVVLNGVYFRDANPGTASLSYADVMMELGDVAHARKDGIQLSSIWKDTYACDTSRPEAWDALYAPVRAAAENPGLRTVDLSRWSEPHYLHASKQDTAPCITYTRPLIVDGQIIGVFGIEVTLRHLEHFFPAEDISGLGGYMLVQYAVDAERSDSLSCYVTHVTGSYIKRYAESGQTAVLQSPAENGGLYTHVNERFGNVSAAVRPLALYSRNAPFSGEQWALLALSPDEVLFEASNNVRMGILQSSLLALVIGTLLMFLSIRHNTKPLLSIAEQIVSNGPDDPVVVKNANTYEVMLLCDTINDMKERRRVGELALREERERYMIALESATDTFIEYDVVTDRFIINYFVEDNGKPMLTSRGVDGFTRTIAENGVCHPADAEELLAVLRGGGERAEPIEVRLRTELFPHIAGASDEGYYWFLFKAVLIAREENVSGKMIGSARQITEEKLAAFAALEAQRRDSTTGAYNREYGELLLERYDDAARTDKLPYHIYRIRMDNFDRFEAYYGQVFSAMILRGVGRALQACIPAGSRNGSLIRWSNDEFAVCISEVTEAEARQCLSEAVGKIYAGENEELTLSASLAAYDCYAAFLAENAARRPPNMDLEVAQESIIGFALDMFEHTTDLASVMQMLFRTLGEVYGLYSVLVCEYDQDFGASRILLNWYANNITPDYNNDSRYDAADFAMLEQLMGENGSFAYTSDSARDLPLHVRMILCVPATRMFSAMCCAMYESGRQMGHVIFASADKSYVWTDAQRHSLYEITKIIATHFSLERSNSVSRAKSEFLSRMSHEIRTPMNAIIGMTKIARDAGGDPARVTDCLDKINASAKHLLALLNDILDMSRIESGKIMVNSQTFNLSDWLDGIDVLLRPQFEEKKVGFRLESGLRHPVVRGDEQKLWQVCLNLLGNALKFTNPGGSVVFAVTQEEAEADGMCAVRFSVKDTGAGIAPEEQARIFAAFEQGATNQFGLSHAKGTGLGLAICSGLVAAMGGRIELESELGAGSEFRFALRLALREEEAECAGDTAGSPEERFAGYRVLVVDDTEINLEIAAFLVESVGFTVDTAVDGREAVDKFFASPPGHYDVIFMDINMPVMDGLAATREIRKNTKRPDARTIPILAMTANAFSEDTKKSIESGMNAHIAKPIDTGLLYATLEKLFPERKNGKRTSP